MLLHEVGHLGNFSNHIQNVADGGVCDFFDAIVWYIVNINTEFASVLKVLKMYKTVRF
jgi:hypothetical protein